MTGIKLSFLVALLFFPSFLFAKTEVDYPALLRSIPPQDIIQEASSQQEMFSLFASYVFELLLIISVFLLVVSIMVGGFLYLFSSGDITKRREAKEKIKSALQGGLIIATSFLLLYTINQQLVLFHQEELEKSREVVEEDYDEWEVIDRYFQIPSGLLIEDAILNSVAQNKLHDVASATQRAEESATNIKEGSSELLKIVRSCPQREPCCGIVEKKEAGEMWDSIIQEHGKMDEREQWLGMAEEALKEQKKQKEKLSPEKKAQLEEYEQLIKEERESIKKDKKHLEDATEYIKEETGEKLPTPPTGGVDEDALIEAILEAEKRLTELNADPDYLHNPELREEGSGLRGKMNLWEEELMKLGYSAEEIEEIKDDHVKDVQLAEEDFSPEKSPLAIGDVHERAENISEILKEDTQKKWDAKSEREKEFWRSVYRNMDLGVYGLMSTLLPGDIVDWDEKLGSEMMFGEDYDWRPDGFWENALVTTGNIAGYGVFTVVSGGTGPIASLKVGGANYLVRAGASRTAANLAAGFGANFTVDFLRDAGIYSYHEAMSRPEDRTFIESAGIVLRDAAISGAVSGVLSEGVAGVRALRGLDETTPRFASPDYTETRLAKIEEYYGRGHTAHFEAILRSEDHHIRQEAITMVEERLREAVGKNVRVRTLYPNIKRSEGAMFLNALYERTPKRIMDTKPDAILVGHGEGGFRSGQEWVTGTSSNRVPVLKRVEEMTSPGERALVVSCQTGNPDQFRHPRGVLVENTGDGTKKVSEVVKIFSPEKRSLFQPRTSVEDGIEIDLRSPQWIEYHYYQRLESLPFVQNNIFLVSAYDQYLRKTKKEHSNFGNDKNNPSPINDSFFDIFQVRKAEANTAISCNWYMPDARPSGAVHSPDSDCVASRTVPMYECYCFIAPEEEIIEEEEEEEEEEETIEEEEEEKERECPPCPDITPQVQAKIEEIENDMGDFEERLEVLLSTKEPIEEDLYHLYKMMMLKSLGHRQVIGYNSLLLERRYREKEEVVIDTYMEQNQIGDYIWDWSQWIDNILYKIETEEGIIEENDPTTFYLRRPEGNQIIEDAYVLAQEIKKEGVQGIEKEWGSENISLKQKHSGNFFATILREILNASLFDGIFVRADEETLSLPGKKDIDPEELTPEAMEEILKELDSDIISQEAGDYLSCGTEIPIGEVFELTWDHLMEILDLIDEYEEEGRRLIEQQAKMNDLASPCSCDCRRDFCPSFCGQCDLTCNLGAIESAHQDVLETRQKLLEIAESIELLTVGHFNSSTEDICDSLNKDVRNEEEKVLCYNEGGEYITKHELISRKLNYSRFQFDECITRPDHLEDFLEGRRTGKASIFGPLAEEEDLSRYTKTEKEGVLVNTSEFNWFCCSGPE